MAESSDSGEPLPRPNSFNTGTELVLHTAYSRCLDFETNVLANPAALPQTGKLSPLICARLIGRLLLEAPTDDGRANVASEIVRCQDDTNLQNMANLYKDHFIRCFYKTNGRTPAPSSHPSAPSFDLKKDEIRALLLATPSSHDVAKAQALERDGYRCIISRRLDSGSVFAGLVLDDGVSMGVVTHCAHIFDRSTNENFDDSAKEPYAASVHAILDRYGGINSFQELNGANIHRLENILTLDTNIHTSFDQLKLWLKKIPDGSNSSYTVEAPSSSRFLLRILPSTQVDFTTSDPVKRPLPDPRYLKLHAACARVAHLSGAAEYIDQILREEEVTKVLAVDGGSSELLNHILMHRLGITAH
ncbi:uncharacterized protein STEHIDRAFT_152697 [Stereum hirsutum FP-91666 SS1]|uniref:uncharacterized protein n=1 Tax=Stereum hirsutum (strain FP-91666) TaxID=721885 RepID=UPI000440A137|nr:uncharacterized protein STEHIDRAFT_152697 [Stereum hirsutum FP-91666 SS1]EIM91014.1 hypothetical protein STEHIDRAFT_152697 [Stereum hirsutum FP-91666 SS1]